MVEESCSLHGSQEVEGEGEEEEEEGGRRRRRRSGGGSSSGRKYTFQRHPMTDFLQQALLPSGHTH
jgi:hypothetical protein